uniref:Regulator of G protein signaling 5a n=1 Tax=Sinocyclocheilus grahami TaxID=75366 RepID=A0A672TDA2_SINGR
MFITVLGFGLNAWAKEIKTKLGTLLQKPENSIDLIIPYQEKPEKKPEKLQKPTPEEAAQWRESLDKVLSNSCKYDVYLNGHSVAFCILKVLPGMKVNIDHCTKDVTLRNLVDLSPSTFELAQSRIYTLMEKDSFGRFLRSEQYQELLK